MLKHLFSASFSFRRRLFVALLGNGLRAVLSFTAGVMVARGLGAVKYGDLSFLLSSFNSLRPLLELGAPAAFFTFISRRNRLGNHFRIYLAWLTLTFFTVLAVVGVFLPVVLYDRVWFDLPRAVTALAFVSVFLQFQAWPMVGQIGESRRQTHIIQLLSVLIAASHLTLVLLLLEFGSLSGANVIRCLIGEYLCAVVIGAVIHSRHTASTDKADEPTVPVGAAIRDYIVYCRPLALSAVAGAFFEFGDRWMLQRFGGALSQGIYQAAFQFAAISLIATTSILQVFWKELSEAHSRGSREEVFRIYSRVSRTVVVIGATLSGLLIPWSQEIIEAMLGPGFTAATPILALLFLYPVHQALGQVNGTLAFATGETTIFGSVTVFSAVVSLIVSYLLQAPADFAPVPGLGLGPLGLALKTVCLNIVIVNTLGWLLARKLAWKYDWLYQPAALVLSIFLGFAAKLCVGMIWQAGDSTLLSLVGPFLLTLVVFGLCQAVFVYRFPVLIGQTRNEIRGHLQVIIKKLT